jgi:hypothetical protein
MVNRHAPVARVGAAAMAVAAGAALARRSGRAFTGAAHQRREKTYDEETP